MIIGIIGAGSVGIQSILLSISRLKEANVFPQSRIQVFVDPLTPPTEVGEAASWGMPDLIIEALGPSAYRDIQSECGITDREGSYFVWDKFPNRNFKLEYTSPGIHFDSGVLGKAVLPRLLNKYPNIEVIYEKVYSTKNLTINDKYKVNLIINCAGSPSKEERLSEKYKTPMFESVNSVYLVQTPKTNNTTYTGTRFVDNGWIFHVPLQHRDAYGYLFNSKISSKNQILEELEKIFPNINKKTTPKLLQWDPYYKTSLVEEGVVSLGNRLYFFEPAQATPLHAYYNLLRNILDKYLLGNYSEKIINEIYRNEIHEIETLLAFNYAGDMEIDTEFWNTTNKNALDFLQTSNHYKYRDMESLRGGHTIKLWSHDSSLMEDYVAGFNINLEKLRRNYE